MQHLLVGVLVVLAAVFAAWRLMGAVARLRLVSWAQRQVPDNTLWHGLLRRMAQQQRVALAGAGCGTCSQRHGSGPT